MNSQYREWLEAAEARYSSTARFFKQLRKIKPAELDKRFTDLHEKYSGQIDCLQCANCCRGTGPLLRERDIVRLARILGMKSKDFSEKYLKMDEEGDMIFQELPCPFLNAENYCIVYEDRPRACREYPHLDRHNIRKYLKPTLENYRICPIVYKAIEELKKNTF